MWRHRPLTSESFPSASYLVIAWQLRRKLSEERIDLDDMDVIDANAEDVRFLQALRHGEVLTPIELIELHEAELGDRSEAVLSRLHHGESLGTALVHAEVPQPLRKKLLAHFASEELADSLDQHYLFDAAGDSENALKMEEDVNRTCHPWRCAGASPKKRRVRFDSVCRSAGPARDFASRALLGLDRSILYLFALAQIAGYALGGCWTHIGSAHPVAAFAFIKRNVDEHYTPIQWIKEMTPVIVHISVLLTIFIYLTGSLLP